MKKLEALLQDIDQRQKLIEDVGELNPDLAKRIQYKFRLDWNYFSNAMEGNSLTRIETKQVMMDNVTIDGKPFKDIAEMRGHDKEVLEIFKIGKGDVRISESRIKQMHKTIMHEDAPEKQEQIGVWKTSDNYLINYKGERIDFLPHTEVPKAIHDLLNTTNAEIDAHYHKTKESKHPALIAFEFHLNYLTIHPFYDGNGRTGRLLMNLLLISFGYPPIVLSESSRDTYYKLLAEVQGYGADPRDFHVFLSELLMTSQQLILDAIEGKDIEDENDVDKEVALWKSHLNEGHDPVLEKSDDVIVRIYQDSIQPLFELFIQKHKQFEDLFLSVEITNFIENKSKTTHHLDYFQEWVNYKMKEQEIINQKGLLQSLSVSKLITHQTGSDFQQLSQINHMTLTIRFLGFKKNGNNPFDDRAEIKIKFDQYKYSVANKQGWIEEKYQKLYTQKYSQEEIKAIVNEYVKAFLERLKERVDKKL